MTKPINLKVYDVTFQGDYICEVLDEFKAFILDTNTKSGKADREDRLIRAHIEWVDEHGWLLTAQVKLENTK